jgi:hypothetical protein
VGGLILWCGVAGHWVLVGKRETELRLEQGMMDILEHSLYKCM